MNLLHASKHVTMRAVNFADLHMHTYFSDGRASPQELLEQAARLGLKTIAITDHETTQGSRLGQTLAPQYGVELIPAIEITCYWDGYTGHGGGPDIDILGYFLELDTESWRETEQRLFEGIVARADATCQALQKHGYRVRVEDVLETNPTYPGFLPLVRTLRRMNLLAQGESFDEAIYYSSGQSPLSIEEGIQLIHDAGGVAVLAHPSIINRASDSEPLTERGVMDLVAMGLDGIEVYHHRLRERQRRHFAMLAKMFRLPISGGSDEHGGQGELRRFGSEPISQEIVEALRAKRRKVKI
jgi:predicted metal-dependent phosphoesterase TrpH